MVSGGAEASIGAWSSPVLGPRARFTSFNDARQGLASVGQGPDGRDGRGDGVVVLEDYEHAAKRGAKMYGEVIGYGLSGDAHHIPRLRRTAAGYRAMQAALKRAKIAPEKSTTSMRTHIDPLG